MSPREHQPRHRWSVEVLDAISHELDEGSSEAVPPGRYTLDEFDWGIYRLSQAGGRRFILSRREVGAYIMERRLTPLDGAWP